jgi:hypothetical protein
MPPCCATVAEEEIRKGIRTGASLPIDDSVVRVLLKKTEEQIHGEGGLSGPSSSNDDNGRLTSKGRSRIWFVGRRRWGFCNVGDDWRGIGVHRRLIQSVDPLIEGTYPSLVHRFAIIEVLEDVSGHFLVHISDSYAEPWIVSFISEHPSILLWRDLQPLRVV